MHDLLRSAYTVDEKAVSELWPPPLFLRLLRTKPGMVLSTSEKLAEATTVEVYVLIGKE